MALGWWYLRRLIRKRGTAAVAGFLAGEGLSLAASRASGIRSAGCSCCGLLAAAGGVLWWRRQQGGGDDWGDWEPVAPDSPSRPEPAEPEPAPEPVAT